MRSNNWAMNRAALIEDRRARVASYKVQGLSMRQTIAAMTKEKHVNPDTGKPWNLTTIKEDVDYLTARWKEEALRDITEVKANELAKLDRLEAEAWAAWERGIGRKQVRISKVGGKEGPSTTLKTEVLNGDPRYLAIILDCQQRRAKMFGLDAPDQLEVAEGFGELLRKARERAQG